MDQSTHDVRRANWLNIIHQCQQRPEDMTAKQWLADNGVKEKSYYYWLRKFRKETCDQMPTLTAAPSTDVSFVEIPVPSKGREEQIPSFEGQTPVAIISSGSLSIAISNDISEALLGRILREVSHA